VSDRWHQDEASRLSVRRVMALVMAIGSHLMLVVLLLRPAGPRRIEPMRRAVVAVGRGADHGLHVVELRLFEPPPASSPLPPPLLPALQRAAAVTPARHPRPPAPAAPPASSSNRPAVPTRGLDLHLPSGAEEGDRLADGDGGFRDRLRSAGQADRRRGLPGTDAHVVPGIRLTAPSDQGIGAVMRKMQRLFGITGHACIDVDVWSGLSRRELAERHITPDQVKRLAERYHCNEPPGLHF
jgi:hypothetical protein